MHKFYLAVCCWRCNQAASTKFMYFVQIRLLLAGYLPWYSDSDTMVMVYWALENKIYLSTVSLSTGTCKITPTSTKQLLILSITYGSFTEQKIANLFSYNWIGLPWDRIHFEMYYKYICCSVLFFKSVKLTVTCADSDGNNYITTKWEKSKKGEIHQIQNSCLLAVLTDWVQINGNFYFGLSAFPGTKILSWYHVLCKYISQCGFTLKLLLYIKLLCIYMTVKLLKV